MAAGDLTTLANVKSWLGSGTAIDDAILTRIITSYSQYIQTWLNRTIASAPYTEKRTGSGSNTMALANYPCTAVSSLTVGGFSVAPSPDGVQAGYVFDDRFIYLIGNVGFGPYFPNSAPNQFPKWPPLGIQIAYTAGFAVTPPELEQAVIELIALRYTERTRIGQQSKSIQGETVSFIVKDMPDSVKTILQNYRKVVPV
ncbi:phage head-tail connector protein [Trinickia mobilis]|uniref:phage head-tail connector protein n=1 Tax=Trinickia mobilis TaxID=2816356 RepID=UPI001A8DCE8B|nr:phage head-tail connector protein [Trinickia mobilis]